ncbi:MAG TPA: contractile injection system protein, VgrG/Pvc8 family [Oligoflexus sp.]|uniref:phage late control D family protein n=1 Tax=Oligoflexus sp. TaxID=1971216 RepID=UPI002D56B99D|nr:contractile injection system protein, VgrG/Pvc8 family [Oligoflexus sp.]HYX35326.1 contractile injection system protein, VgrG/Pvc8 family [Oligoflexus sp.]
MTIPRFKINANGEDLTREIRKRFLGLTVKDEAGFECDSIQLQLSDNPPIVAPKEGTRLEVWVGYDEELYDLGLYAARPISLKGPPATATIEAGVIDCYPSLKIPKKKSWRPGTLEKVLIEICKTHGLKAAIDPDCSRIKVPHEDQTESDAAFLARLAEHYECIFKIQRDHLIFFDRDSATTPNGSRIKPVTIRKPIDYDFKYVSDPVYSGVKAFWWDRNSAREKSVISGKEGRVHAIKFLMKDEASARVAADAKFKKLKRLSSRLSVTVPGNPLLYAGGRCSIEDLRPQIDGEWMISSVEHILDHSGYTSKITSEGKVS